MWTSAWSNKAKVYHILCLQRFLVCNSCLKKGILVTSNETSYVLHVHITLMHPNFWKCISVWMLCKSFNSNINTHLGFIAFKSKVTVSSPLLYPIRLFVFHIVSDFWGKECVRRHVTCKQAFVLETLHLLNVFKWICILCFCVKNNYNFIY